MSGVRSAPTRSPRSPRNLSGVRSAPARMYSSLPKARQASPLQPRPRRSPRRSPPRGGRRVGTLTKSLVRSIALLSGMQGTRHNTRVVPQLPAIFKGNAKINKSAWAPKLVYHTYGKYGPVLTGVVPRWTPEEVRQQIYLGVNVPANVRAAAVRGLPIVPNAPMVNPVVYRTGRLKKQAVANWNKTVRGTVLEGSPAPYHGRTLRALPAH